MFCEIFQDEVGAQRNFNYFVACASTKRCAFIDPAFETDRFLAVALSRGWSVAAILVTHTHRDHVEGVAAAAAATGAPVYVGAGEAEALGQLAPSAEIHALHDGALVAVGALGIAALATPGHTVAGTSYLVDGCLFTGDTLFVGGCGRSDFPGGDAPTLWRSLSRLAALPEETRVYPGHDYGQTRSSTIGWERASNPYLLCKSEAEFVALRTGKQPPRPERGPR